MGRGARSDTRRNGRGPGAGRGAGFTMVELLIVIVIISILVAFILTAAMAGVRQAEERATQALIAKLDAGLNDRVDAILATRADALVSHDYVARVWPSAAPPVRSNGRAQTLARFDQIAAEMPDVFVVQGAPAGLSTAFNYYPLNFAAGFYQAANVTPSAGLPSNALAGDALLHYQFVLPMGVAVQDNPASNSFGADPPANLAFAPTGTGIYGASYAAAAGLYKSLFEAAARDNPTFVLPSPKNAGFDGIDNDNDGLVDELNENGGPIAGYIAGTLLPRHTHKTARAEVLYALLVEGQWPFGSVFSRDEFRDTEVKDTDGDGLPEFVDAWGEPIQYFRWPIFFKSDAQKGAYPYALAQPFFSSLGVSASNPRVSYESRQQDPLDPNQTMVDPSWWSNVNNSATPFGTATGPLSGAALYFQAWFHCITDPNTNPALSNPALQGQAWDRGMSGSAFFARRAYQSRHLILSGGPDKAPGVPVLDASYNVALAPYLTGTAKVPTIPTGGVPNPSGVPLINLRIEGQAAQATPIRTSPAYLSGPDSFLDTSSLWTTDALTIAIRQAGGDDIHSHSINGPGGATQ